MRRNETSSEANNKDFPIPHHAGAVCGRGGLPVPVRLLGRTPVGGIPATVHTGSSVAGAVAEWEHRSDHYGGCFSGQPLRDSQADGMSN